MRSSSTRLATRRGSVLAAVVVVVLLARAAFLSMPASPDEAGFLMVGGQWHADGSSLYGDYWVDRPPLLIGIFRLAALTGGLLPLRLIGMLAAAVTVVLCGLTAERVAGRRAAVVAAVVAGALLVNPMVGADRVNGELLGLPFVAAAMYAAVRAIEPRADARWAVATGAAAAAALLVKQNLADAVVFAVVLWAAWALRRDRTAPVRTLAALLGRALLGGAVVGVIAVGWAAAHGTDPRALFDALYPFRLRAAEVLADEPSVTGAERAHELAMRAVLAGEVVLGLLVVVAAAVRRTPVALAAAAALLFGATSVVLGGSWWSHYLLQPVPAAAIGLGALAAARPRVASVAAIATGIAAAAAVVTLAPQQAVVDNAVRSGEAVAVVARPGDTVVNLWGRPDVVRATGLSSPWDQLWSLPVRTDDAQLADLLTLLAGPSRPTWVLEGRTPGEWRLPTARVNDQLSRHYREVGEACGRRVWVRADADRAAPPVPRCSGPVGTFLR